MQQEIGDIALQCDLLALSARLEAARSGDAGRVFARQADTLRELSNDVNLNSRKKIDAGDTANLLRAIEFRLERLLREQDDISAFAAEVSNNAGCETSAWQFEDVVSQVVVYSSEQAELLRSLVAQIESGQKWLDAEIVKDRDEIRQTTESFRQQPGSSPDD